MAHNTTKTCAVELVIPSQAAAAPVGHGCEVVEAKGGADLGPPGPLGLLLQVGSRALPRRHLRLAVLPVLLSGLQPVTSSEIPLEKLGSSNLHCCMTRLRCQRIKCKCLSHLASRFFMYV